MKTPVYILALACLVFSAYGCGHMQGRAEPAGYYGSGITGRVSYADEGVAPGVFVYAYRSPHNDLRVPTDLISGPTAKDGSYSLDLPPGRYWVVSRKRISGDPRGYLVKGDYEGKYRENPVTVEPGSHTRVDISISKLEGAFLLAPYLPDKGGTGLSGTVYDEDGNPARGAYVMLYADKEMVGIPAYLSKPTGRDGGYSVYLPGPGTYYVAARLKYGGLPVKGEPYGTYGGDPDHKVRVGDNELVTGVDVNLKPFPHDLRNPVP